MPIESITDVLGNTLPVTRTYGDGSVDCPFCYHPIITPKTACENPWCVAMPQMTPEAARKLNADVERKRQEEAERKRNHEWAMQRIERENEERQAAYSKGLAEVRESGHCVGCFAHKGKRIKHRAECPRDRNSIYRDLGLSRVRGALGGTYYE